MAKISMEALKSAIDRANSIVLTVHIHPDGDALGSMLACYEALVNQGKQVWMVVDDVVPDKYRFLTHADKILPPQALKTIDNPHMLLVLDASTLERIGEVGALTSAPIFNIDHHVSNTDFAEGLYLREDFSSTGEVLAYLFTQWNWPITASMGNALYTAMAMDTGFFKFSNTTGHTLDMAALCVKCGAQPHVVSEHVELVTPEKIEVMKEALQQVAFHHDGRVSSISLSLEMMEKIGDDTDGYVDMIRNVEGVDVAILLKAKSHTQTRVSLRSKGTDVNAIAQRFGGGGHIRAAGCTVEAPIEEALVAVVKELA